MKIGILTFHRAMNYGAILQAYALEHKLNEIGADTCIVDYRNDEIENCTKLIGKNEKFGLKTLPKVIFRFIKHRKFNYFIKSNINLSKAIYNADEMAALSKNFDAFISGSDQVWNDGCINDDIVYFQSFDNNIKKYTYAASIGGDIERAKRVNGKFQEYIGLFDKISLRESNIEPYFIENYGDRVRCDIDPVLLFNSNDWLNVMSKRRHKKPYIFVYLVGEPNNIRGFASNLSSKYGLDLIDNKSNIEFMRYSGPEDFLSWIYNADIIVTNSFHGTAFSVLFKKNFYCEFKSKNGYNYRSQQLLSSLGIDNREILTKEEPNTCLDVDYTNADIKLEKLRKKSLDYLKFIVGNK